MQLKQLVLVLLMPFIADSQLEEVKCRDNEIPGPKCGTLCPPTCSMPVPTGPCPLVCVIDGCVCKPGDIREQNISSPCIPQSQCPPKCGPNERYSKCNYTTCVAACDRKGDVNCPIMGVRCVGGCLCKDNYQRLTYKNLSSPCVAKCPYTM